MTITRIILFSTILVFVACHSKYKYVDDNKFIGEWELKGRSSFEGMQIKIYKTDNKLKGTITKVAGSKYVKMFAEEGEIWIKDIKRNSNFSFTLTETKLAAGLFSMYGLSTNNEFMAEFINNDKIGLAQNGIDPQKSPIYYERLKNQ